MSTDVGRFYERLSPSERASAVIAARSRDDRAEVERLTRACSRRLYVELDAPFSDRITMAERVTTTLAIEIRSLLSQLVLIGEVLSTVTDETAVEHLGRIGRVAAERARVARDGFEQWAHSEGLDPLELVGAFAGFLVTEMERLESVLDMISPEPDDVTGFALQCSRLVQNRDERHRM